MSTYDERSQNQAATGAEGLKERAVESVAEVDAGAMHVAGVAGEEAKNVAHEAKSAARGLLHETRMQLADQASTQKHRAADALRSTGDELSQMADSASGDGVATGLVRGLGRRTSDVATWLEDREPGDLVREVRGFARRHTGAFLVAAIGVGIVAGRLTKALASGGGDGSDATAAGTQGALDSAGYGGYASSGGTSYPATGGTTGAAGGMSYPATGAAGSGASGAGMRAGDAPIGDALAGETMTDAATTGQPDLVDPDEPARDEWSPSGEGQR